MTDPSNWSQDSPGKYPLVRTLQQVVQSAYEMLLHGHAEDWPTFYYTYFILGKIAGNLTVAQRSTTTFQRAASKFDDDIEEKLCGFASYVTKGNDLCDSKFDIKNYELLVSDPVLRKECVHMNKMWTTPVTDWGKAM